MGGVDKINLRLLKKQSLSSQSGPVSRFLVFKVFLSSWLDILYHKASHNLSALPHKLCLWLCSMCRQHSCHAFVIFFTVFMSGLNPELLPFLSTRGRVKQVRKVSSNHGQSLRPWRSYLPH